MIDWIRNIDRDLLLLFMVMVGVSLVLALGLIVWVIVRVRRIRLPADADALTALLATPLSVVVLIDLLDLGLDFFSAPISWVLLDRLGLGPLRGVAVVEALIPGTQFIPTMTLAWVLVRLFRDRIGS